MTTDLYDLPLSTSSERAADLYRQACQSLFFATPGTIALFQAARDEDPDFALAHIGEARAHQMMGDVPSAREAATRAEACSRSLTDRETAHLSAFLDLIGGRIPQAYSKIRAHLREHPRDALIAQTCMGVFSLIGFSGRPGREAEHLAFCETLAPAYGNDGWFLSQIAFAQLEAGQLDAALPNIEAGLAAHPNSAHAAHIRAHLYYEMGETQAGLAFLSDWMSDYARDGLMHCHNSWHIALWALAQGDETRMWDVVEADLLPEVSVSPALNILTDLASLYFRAELAGVDVPASRWKGLSGYASKVFPKPGLGFADMHSAIAHAMAGEADPLEKLRKDAKGPVADLIPRCADAFDAMARQDWPTAISALTTILSDHARLGGSRAQRDLLEFAMVTSLMRAGHGDEARRLLAIHRPVIDVSNALPGLL